MPECLRIILLPIGAYLLGSIPFGLVLTDLSTGRDVRLQGSGNIGATNVRRVAGDRIAALALAADVLKGALPCAAALHLAPGTHAGGSLYTGLTAMAAIGGHLFPLFLKFRTGGKGVATAAGAFGVLCPVATLIALLIFVLMACISDRVSVGSMTAAVCLPGLIHLAGYPLPLTAWALIAAAAIVRRHKDNLARLWRGEEPRIGG